ncbi:ABC transporter permease subunit [Sulfitobacter mediterraneus]|uniref:ABC transporter permease n=1 Tax=Sulfitobacter mediterraneus TaxID=83219 RepID=UPI0019343F0A|nr:ABC transporter permease subunit [Sulfitobacter mediterraneus]MBM1311522.1 ABC transporter permease subunit [Sulfitobacter mediterraneus]MBM1315404.1 ABC transporter permease subunit [Sulfitobacter mediterraneus]MBM1323765.1 ABC transporter permease subunit [Sulfitobacter mediterraneus]MBM1327677.1 ABC transporter permease subunit [Sulfitobacter mediterraneus]MBM1399025.1 ABC transporter permease subunit [Sulfitobacter mediterraneus]
MTDQVVDHPPPKSGKARWLTGGRLFWLILLAVTWAASTWSFALYKALDARWIVRFPKAYQIPVDDWLSDFTKWLVEDLSFGWFTFRDVTRFIASLIEAPYDLVRSLLLDGFAQGQGQQAVEIVPALSWIAIIFVFVALAKYARGWKLAALVGTCFAYLAIFGQWASAMVTLASVLIAVPIGAIGGLLLGIAAYRSVRVERLMRPVLDLMQTVPVFAYLVPILVLFGFGPVAALIATVIYAMPPMVRNTTVALQSVPEQLIEAGKMMGCKRRQLMWKVMVPAALPSIMVGVNQVIMLTLNMVIIASMIGAGGLGYDVLTSLRRLDIGGGVEAGFAIVVMAIALDRLSQAFAERQLRPQPDKSLPLPKRYPWVTATIVVVACATLASLFIPFFRVYPIEQALTTGTIWESTIAWININFFDAIDAVKTFLLTWLLLPVKQFFGGIPWPVGIVVTGLAAGRAGGWRLGLLAAAMMTFIAATGLWNKAMITIYLTSVAVLLASVIGIPLGIWAGQNARANSVIGAIIDTLQTLPSFVYLIPVIMLFRVGDFSALIAIVLYALAPAVRYAAHGIRSIDPELIEAGKVAGCTNWQLLRRIKLPLAAPSLLLGLNQTIMLALSMLVITALVGTRDLGQEVYIALTKANVGKGIVAGLGVAFLAIIADRVVNALARQSRERLGLE